MPPASPVPSIPTVPSSSSPVQPSVPVAPQTVPVMPAPTPVPRNVIPPIFDDTTQTASAQTASTAGLFAPPNVPSSSLPRSGSGGGTSEASDSVTTARQRGRRHSAALLVAIIAVVAIAAATSLTAFLTYRAEIWGGKVLPDPQSFATQATGYDGKIQSVVKAKDVTDALNAKGLQTKTVQEFSGQTRGAFLGYEGANQGDRVSSGSTVTVRESAGPGVPKDTMNQQAADVVDALAAMGVPVHYKQVIIAADSKTPEGQVTATYPTPGSALPDDQVKDGIYVGVATKANGIPVDIMGMDKDAAVSELKSQGFDVDIEMHFSSKQYVGKVSGSYPAPGSSLQAGSEVTLYIGADSSSTKDLLTTTSGGEKVVGNNATPMIGMYCKSEVRDQSRDCVTLEAANGPYGSGSLGGGFMQIKEHKPTNPSDTLGLVNFSQGLDGVMLEPSHGLSADKLPLANHLLLKDWGMFELYAGMGLPNCGDTVTAFSIGSYCDHGTYRTQNPSDGFPSGGNTGLTYRMKDFLVYVPVGSDLQALEDSGYFDDDALATAKGQKAVDADRPFIIMRDSTQYDTTEEDVPSSGALPANPFVPTNETSEGGKNALVPMKPAPSDSTVYYLMEQDGDLDWSSLPDANVKVADGNAGAKEDDSGSGGKSGASAGKPSDGASGRLDATAMKQVAGDYTWPSSGMSQTLLTIESDGSFSGKYQEVRDETDNIQSASGDEIISTAFSGTIASIKANDAGGYDMTCDSGAFEYGDSSGSAGEKGSGMSPCTTWHWYPKNAKTNQELRDQWGVWAYGGLDPDSSAGVVLVTENAKGMFFKN